MADGGKNQFSFFPVSGILALIVIAGVAVFTQTPLKGTRPAIDKVESTTEKVDARLWQDPFRAVLDTKLLSTHPTDVSATVKDNPIILAVMMPGAQYAEESELRLRWRYAVLAGLRRLGYAPEDSEHLNYVIWRPFKDSAVVKKVAQSKADKIGMMKIVPFEKLIKHRGKASNVLLLWINEEFLTDSSLLKSLNNLLDDIKIKKEANVKIIGPSSSTRLLSIVKELSDNKAELTRNVKLYSATATMETRFLKKYGGQNAELPSNKKRSLEIDITDERIAPKVQETVSITRTIKPDDVLTESLVTELAKRNCLERKGSAFDKVGTVAVISEWDTQYGRLLPLSFEDSLRLKTAPDFTASEFSISGLGVEKLCQTIEDKGYAKRQTVLRSYAENLKWLNKLLGNPELYMHMKEHESKQVQKDIEKIYEQFMKVDYGKIPLAGAQEKPYMARWLNRMLLETVFSGEAPRNHKLLRFSYLRGIDGKVPGEDQKDNSKTDNNKDKEDFQDMVPSGIPEEPVGKSQYDYLRRLADKIYEKDRDLKLAGEKGITAIGVLGTDFYDKYLILQAVRQRLPECVYFTTELDARYLQADNIKWTRNLIVASHFGFELRGQRGEDLLGDVPPFRDAYQTSVYYAILKAFESDEKDRSKLANADTTPRLFEIGRRNAIDLANYNQRTNSFLKSHWWKIVIFLVLAMWLLAYSSFRVQSLFVSVLRDIIERVREKWLAALLGYGVLLICLGFLSYFPGSALFNSLQYEEPFSLFEGVSIWPTEILRLSAMLLSLFFILLIYDSSRKNQADLSRDYALGSREHDDLPDACGAFLRPLHSWKAVCDLHSHNFASFNRRGYQEGKVNLRSLWNDYVKFGDCGSRTIRVLISSGLFFAVALLLLCIFGIPNTPSRGMYTWWTDKFILGVTLAAFIFLTFLAVDATRLCSYFIIALTKNRPEWSDRSLNYYLTASVKECHEDIYGEWMLVDFVARHTETIQRFILYPVAVLIILFFSRNSFIDNWQSPLHLMAIISLSAAYAWSASYRLRRAAENLRSEAKKRLERKLDKEIFKAKNAGAEDDEDSQSKIEQIKHVAKEVEDIKTGAFAPLSQHPLVHSLLAAAGGIGGTALLQFLNFFNM